MAEHNEQIPWAAALCVIAICVAAGASHGCYRTHQTKQLELAVAAGMEQKYIPESDEIIWVRGPELVLEPELEEPTPDE